MKHSNHRTAKSKAKKPMTTLAIIKKDLLREEAESPKEFEDRAISTAYIKLSEIKKRTEKQESEFQELRPRYIAAHFTKGGYVPGLVSDEMFRQSNYRMHEELQQEFGTKSVMKNILIDR